MEHMLTRIYALLVCFVSIVCIAITTGVALYNVVSLVDPELTVSPYRLEYLNHPQSMTNTVSPVPVYPGQPLATKHADMTEEELESLRAQQLEVILDTERRSAKASLVRLVIILIVSIPLYLVHWRLARRLEGIEST